MTQFSQTGPSFTDRRGAAPPVRQQGINTTRNTPGVTPVADIPGQASVEVGEQILQALGSGLGGIAAITEQNRAILQAETAAEEKVLSGQAKDEARTFLPKLIDRINRGEAA